MSTLPGNTTTAVPVDTGIEVTFDQDGAGDMTGYFSISPAVKGRFERNGRTQVFVPSGLRAHTLYTVTIRHGLPIKGTDLALEQDVRFRFETAGPTASPPFRFRIGRDVLETSPADRAVIGLQVVLPDREDGSSAGTPAKVSVRIYRFPTLESTLAGMREFLDAPGWTEWTEPSVPTTGLRKALSFTASLHPLSTTSDQVIVVPTRLPRGWYLVEIGRAGAKAQAFLQVTEVSAWVTVLSDRTVVWVNDVARGRAIRGATVRVAGGPSIGRTGSNGLLVAETPVDLVPSATESSAVPQSAPPVPILIVRGPNGHALLVPFDTDRNGGTYRGEWSKGGPARSDGWWSLLSTDRAVYRRDDRVEAWGFLRRRVDGQVPATVDLRLVLPANQDQADPVSIVKATARTRTSGAYAASLTLDGVPLGSYVLEAFVDGQAVSRTWLDVGIIRKPAYRVTVLTDRHVVLADQTVLATVEATFFDGQPVPGTPFAVGAEYDTTTSTDPTGADGRATTDWLPRLGENAEGSEWRTLSVTTARPEEGEIGAEAAVLVFPNAVNLDADGSLTGRRLAVTGSVHDVDFARLERQLSASPDPYQDVDPNGRPLAGATVSAEISELIPVRHLDGYDYDPITKRVTPRYEYDTRAKHLRTVTVKTVSSGAFRLSVRVPHAGHDYRVVVSVADADGRVDHRTITATRRVAAERGDLPIFEIDRRAPGAGPCLPDRRPGPADDDRRCRAATNRRTQPLPVRRLEAGSPLGDGHDQPALHPAVRRRRRTGHLHHRRPVHRPYLRPEGRRLGVVRHPGAADRRRPVQRPVELPARRRGDGDGSDHGREGPADPRDPHPARGGRKALRDGRRAGHRPARRPLPAGRERDRPADRDAPAADRRRTGG